MTFEEVQEKLQGTTAYLTEEDKKTLYRYASKVPQEGVIVDIGTAFGGSAIIMTLASEADVFTIDPQENQHFMDKREALGLSSRLTYLKDTSARVANCFGGLIDLLFIDGIHSYQGVKDDLEGLGKLVKKSGIILIHDYFLYDGIQMVVDEYFKNGFMKKIDIVDSLYQGEKRIGMVVAEKL